MLRQVLRRSRGAIPRPPRSLRVSGDGPDRGAVQPPHAGPGGAVDARPACGLRGRSADAMFPSRPKRRPFSLPQPSRPPLPTSFSIHDASPDEVPPECFGVLILRSKNAGQPLGAAGATALTSSSNVSEFQSNSRPNTAHTRATAYCAFTGSTWAATSSIVIIRPSPVPTAARRTRALPGSRPRAQTGRPQRRAPGYGASIPAMGSISR